MIRFLHLFLTLTVLSLFTHSAVACDNHPKEEQSAETKQAGQELPNELNANSKVEQPSNFAKKEVNAKNEAKKDIKPESTIQKDAKAESNISQEEAKALPQAVADLQASSQASSEVKPDLQVLEFVLTNQIEAREPKEVVESFAAGQERGFAFARIASKTKTDITFVWFRNGHECARQTMPIQAAAKWRTNASVKLRPGDWKVQLMANNEVLAEKSFTLE